MRCVVAEVVGVDVVVDFDSSEIVSEVEEGTERV